MTELPSDVVALAERLTLAARRADDEAAAEVHREERDEALAGHGFAARVREEGDRAVLVCYPAEWMADGTVQLDRVEDRSRAVEVPLDGVGDEDWAAVEDHNRELVAAVEADAGPVHAANTRAFADFMGNHYLRGMETAGDELVAEFLTEYYPRNAWPSRAQREAVEESLRLVFEAAGREPPSVLT